jgi:hypothetical protein
MKIGIEVNGVLRDTIGKLVQVYEKFLLDKNEETESETFEMVGDTEELIKIGSETKFNYEIIEPIDTLNIDSHFKFQNKEEQFSFFYEEFPMHIFGHAPSTEMTTFNELNEFYTNFRNENDIWIISDEIGKSKPSTLFFLSKFGCLIENISFYNTVTSDKILSSFDLIVTSNPDIIINYSDKLGVIKFETAYNKQVRSKHTITSLKELSETLNKIQNAEII